MTQIPTRSRTAVGFTMFAAAMLILAGIWNALEGLVGLIKNDYFVVTPNYLFKFNVTTWGWINLVLGILLVLAGVAVLQGAVWARSVGVLVAGLVAIASFLWLPYYPVWAIIIIALCVVSIWALTAHGRDITMAE